ncbi:MAG: hypothetical protein HY699_21740 [Deltaproteobacteria bacterium]|nr:hypothetical protein [Deltaproteobacteria bacterium]
MAAKTSTRQQSEGLLQWLVDRGEHTVGQILDELFSHRGGVAKTIDRAAKTKGQFDSSMQTVLSLLSLPSRADYAKLAAKLETLQGSLINLNMKLDRLLAASAAPPKPARKPPRPPVAHAEDGSSD